jgi:20S proteasome alpha/beta subunit
MTVVVGLRCESGIVLCADQQVSAPGAFKYNECKINTETISDESVIFAYSGLPSLAREAREKITKKLEGVRVSYDSVYRASDEVLTDMGRLYAQMELQMLIGTAVLFEESTLLKFDGKGLHVADDYNFLGVGDSSLLRFLAEAMYSKQMNNTDAVNLAIYLVRKAEKYIDGCGGPIDAAILHWGDEICEMLSNAEVQDRIKQMERQETALTDLIVRSSPT